MSEENTEKKQVLPNELKEKLDADKRNLDEQKANLLKSTDAFDKDSSEFVEEIKTIEDDSNEHAEHANELLHTARTNAEDFVTTSKTLSQNISSVLDDTLKKIKRLFGALIVVGVALFVVLYYFGPSLLSLFGIDYEFDPLLMTGIIILVCFIALVIKIVKSVDSKIANNTKKQTASLSNLEKNTTPLTRTKIRFNFQKEKISNKINAVGDNLYKISVGVQGYVLGLKEHFDGLALLNRQSRFALTMRNALKEYGLTDDSIDEKLRGYSSLKHNEEQWVHDASNDISKLTGVSAEILVLCYYDYDGNKAEHANASQTVHDSQKIDELVKILKKNFYSVPQTNVKDRPFNELITDVIPFSLSKFTTLYNEFYNEFGKEKKLLVQTLRDLGFKVNSEQQRRILDIFPTTTNSEEWSEHLISQTANILEEDPTALLLLYTDKIGESGKRDREWNASNNDPKVQNSLAESFIRNNSFPDEFQKEDLKKLCIHFLSKNTSSLNIGEITNDVWKTIQQVQRTKKLFAYAMEAKKSPIPNKIMDDNYSKLLVYGDIEGEIASKLSELVNISADIILLFYFDYVHSPQRRVKFDELKQDVNLETRNKLAVLLLEKLIQKESGGNEKAKLSSILYRSDDFDLDIIKQNYVFYHKIFDDVRDFVRLLNQEKIVNNGVLDFDTIVTTLQNNYSSRYDALKKISMTIINKKQQVLLQDEQIEPFVIALLVIYFQSDFDSAREDACKDASTKPFSIKLLYEWIARKGDELELGKHESNFQDIIKPVIDDATSTSFEHIGDFKEKLEDGKLAGSIKALLSARFKHVSATAEKYNNEKYVNVLTKVSATLNNVLNMKINKGFIKQALKSQLISAYILTYKQGSVMTIMKEYMKPACKTLSADNSEFKNFMIMREQESESGKGTRVGVVPLHIKDFEEFNVLFQEAFELSAKNFKKDNPDKGDSFSANLIRIIPSPLAFKQVSSNVDATKTDPIQTVIDMIKTDFDPVDRLKLAASGMGQGSPDVALKEILEDVFNDTKTISFVDETVADIVSQNTTLNNIFDNGTLISELRTMYDVQKTTDLADFLYLDDLKNTENTFVQFSKFVDSIFKKHQIQLTELDQKKICKSLFDNFIDIAKFLRGTL